MLAPGVGHDLVPHRVHYVDGLANFVHALCVTGPAGHNGRAPHDLGTVGQVGTDDREDKLGDAV